jgi:dipeptidyl aminopeptidase/acylaminoacyl peptidase
MVRFFAALALVSCALAQTPPFSIDQVLGAAFPYELTAAPSGGRVAWVSNARGVRNILVAEPPDYRARKVTAYTQDDGQELGQLAWAPDASTILYVRVDGANRAGEYPNPALDPNGAEQDVWIVALDGSAPRRIGEGHSPAVSPKGNRVAFIRRGQLWLALLDGKTAPTQAFKARGTCGRAVWSPDGARIAFESDRGDHAFIGVYDAAAGAVRYLDPSTDSDKQPEWSSDSRNVAFLRIPGTGQREPRGPRRGGPPWSIRVADAETGAGKEIWRAHEGPGSVFREVAARNQLLWSADGRVVFPWEGDGWTHLYSVPAAGGEAMLLTPGAFEVEDVALPRDGREVVYSSNQQDIDRRHLWKVAASGGPVKSVTAGNGIELSPAILSNGDIALLQSDARRPLHATVIRDRPAEMDPDAVPADFPLAHMVTPQPVTFSSADGMAIHGELFLPPKGAGTSDARHPAVVFFHGGSQRQMLLGWHPMYYYSNAYGLNQYLANSGYVVLAVNYRGGIGNGLDFREALNAGPAGGSEYNDVEGAGVYLRGRPDVDPARIAAWGGSYGGYLTGLALARASDLYRAGVDIHGVNDWATELGIPSTEPDYRVAYESSPMASVATWRSPVLLIHGDDDRSVQFNQTVALAAALRHQKVEIEELIFPDEVHEFLLYSTWRRAYEAAADFLSRHLR